MLDPVLYIGFLSQWKNSECIAQLFQLSLVAPVVCLQLSCLASWDRFLGACTESLRCFFMLAAV